MDIQTICTNTATGFNCSTTLPYVSDINASGSEFYINKTWNYGELFISFLLVFIILFYFGGAIFKFFFETFVRIKRKTD